jgi:hypothetical protein
MKSNPFIRTGFLYLFLAHFLFSGAAVRGEGDFDWNLPIYKFDNINEFGFVDIWSNLGSLELGNNQDIPLNIEFQSNRNSSSTVLGKGWYFPLLESHIEQQDDNTFAFYLPDGRKLLFYRNVKTDPSTLQGPGEWKAQIDQNTITAWIDKKSKLTFTNGMVTGITLPDGGNIDYLYSGNLPSEIRKNGVTLFKVDVDQASQQVTGLEWTNGTERHEAKISMSNKPRVDFLAGTPVIGGVDKSLNELSVVGGRDFKFDYAVTDKMIPSLKFNDGDGDTTFTWDPIQHNVISANDDLYTIDNSDGARSIASQNKKIGTVRKWVRASDGSSESYSDGPLNYTITYFTSGFLLNKPRTNVTTDGGVTTSEAYTYNEQGDLIRTTYSQGTQTIVRNWLTQK